MKRVVLAGTIAIVTVMLCACGSAGSAGEASSTTLLAEKIPDDDPTRQTYTDLADEESTKGASMSDEATPVETDSVSSIDLYEKFLNDEVRVLIRLDKIQNSDAFFDYGPSDGTEYTLSELMATVSRDTEEHSISYAYMDCGNDGNLELAVRTESTIQATSWWEYWIIKDVGGNLECIYARENWPRSNATINQYGLINGYGSNGAANHTYDEMYLDATGAIRYIYTLNTIGFAVTPDGYGAIYEYDILPPNDIGSDQRSFLLFQYDFDNTTDNHMNDACAYGEQDPNDPVDDEGDRRRGKYGLLQDESIYDDSFPLKTQLIDAGFQVYRFSEIDEMIDAQENYYGITQEILDAPEVEWTVLSTQ